MIWLRVLAGVLFLGWSGMIGYTGWLALRSWPRAGKSVYGELDPHSEEFRRLIHMK